MARIKQSKMPNLPGAATGHKTDTPGGVRLQRVLAQAGHGSRRQCEDLIVEGRVCVDGQVVDQLGTRVDPDAQKIEVDGTLVRAARYQYFMVNKPQGVLSTNFDPDGRMRVIDLINTDQRVYNVGRLDKSSEGLILVTNDGDLANRLTHPRYGVQKTYLVTVVGSPHREELELLRQGVRLAEGTARVTEVRVKKKRRENCELLIVLDEGRNREIRRLLARIGHKVTRLKRIAIGPLQLGDLVVGGWRRLVPAEVEALRKASAHTSPKKKPALPPVGEGQFEKGQETRRQEKELARTRGRRSRPGATDERSTRGESSKSATGRTGTSIRSIDREKAAPGSRTAKPGKARRDKVASGSPSKKGKPKPKRTAAASLSDRGTEKAPSRGAKRHGSGKANAPRKGTARGSTRRLGRKGK
jgi:23S rRNA pseudouridine2605 synthase